MSWLRCRLGAGMTRPVFSLTSYLEKPRDPGVLRVQFPSSEDGFCLYSTQAPPEKAGVGRSGAVERVLGPDGVQSHNLCCEGCSGLWAASAPFPDPLGPFLL